jgi:hypothetical protein
MKKKKKKSKKAIGRGTRKKKSSGKAARKKSRTKPKTAVRKKSGKKGTAATRRRPPKVGYVVDTLVGLEKESRVPPGLQSGDLQGLSNVELADSQSVDELLEEGNAFEAGVVEGVEKSEDSGTREVRTRQVPVDDVPEEYLDQD